MELQQLRYVLAVAETRNFTRAAQQCFVVQSALSHQIAALERELGFKLFARTSRRVDLTASGQAFLPGAEVAVRSAEQAVAEAAAAVGEIRGRLKIGIIPTVTAIDIPSVLRKLHQRHPMVTVSLQVGRSDEMVRDLRAGTLHVAVLGLSDTVSPDGVQSRVLAHDHHVAVVGQGHRLARRRRITLEELVDEPFADFPEGSPGRSQTDLAFAGAQLHREVAYESMDPTLIVGLVRERLAVALLPSALAPTLDGVTTVLIKDGPARTEYLAWDGFNISPVVQALLDLVTG